jgi:hypothetical protein
MSSGVQFVVLCEDLQAQVFICRALIRAGANARRIRKVPLPSTVAGGAGHAYVVANYPREVKAFRRQNASASTALVAHIDADPTHTVAGRHAQLADALKAAGERHRQPTEPIAELVPKRNIETWIYALDGSLSAGHVKSLNEVEAYPKIALQSECSRAAEAFADHARLNTAPQIAGSVPSLLDGIAEFRRLP